MKRRWLFMSVALLLGAGLLSGCGSDDDASSEAFCDGFLELNAGDEPTAKQIRAVAADAPGDAKTALEEIADGFEKDGAEYFDGEDFGTHFKTVNEVAGDECADDEVTITASEYKYEGIPKEFDAGVLAVTLKNAGGEFHEVAIAKKKDGVDKTFDEILAMEEDEADKFVDFKGGTFSEPGDEAAGLFDLSEKGDYIAVCFVSVGSTPDNDEAEGPPHFTKGMKSEFTVS